MAVLAIVAIVAAGWSLARPVPAVVGKAPADLQAQAVTFASSSETMLHGWWCPVPASSGSILLLTGVRANRLSMISRARFLREAGFSVLLIDFRGTGESRGGHIPFGWDERNDVLSAVEYLRRRTPGSHVGIIGSSLGGAAALLATPPLHVDALVLESVYPTIEDATGNRLRKYLGAAGPAFAPLLLAELYPIAHVAASDLRPIDHVRELLCPVLLMSGEADRNTLPQEVLAMYEAAPEPKELWLVPNAGHVDLHRFARAEYEQRVTRFFCGLFGRPAIRPIRRSAETVQAAACMVTVGARGPAQVIARLGGHRSLRARRKRLGGLTASRPPAKLRA